MGRAQNFRIIREFKRKTPVEVEKGTGISKQNISLWDNGGGNPGPDFVKKLATFFDLPAAVFYEESLTKEYLEKHHSGKNGTGMQKSTDNTQKDEVYRTIVEGGTEYLLIPRSVLQDKYRLRSLEDIEKDNKVLDRLLDAHEKMLTRLLLVDPKFVGIKEGKQDA